VSCTRRRNVHPVGGVTTVVSRFCVMHRMQKSPAWIPAGIVETTDGEVVLSVVWLATEPTRVIGMRGHLLG
jgi:hypothetical protein